METTSENLEELLMITKNNNNVLEYEEIRSFYHNNLNKDEFTIILNLLKDNNIAVYKNNFDERNNFE